MATSTRIYVITGPKYADEGKGCFLVEAATAQQAVRYIVGQQYNAQLATQKVLVDLTLVGVKVESAVEEAE